MRRRFFTVFAVLALVGAAITAGATLVVADVDFGTRIEQLLAARSRQLLGVRKPLPAGFTGDVPRAPEQRATDLVALAGGLRGGILTRNVADSADMFSFWPAEDPQWLVFCIEGDREVIGVNPDGSDKYNPSVQRVAIADGTVETVLRGMTACDGIRTTPWGTVIATEETDDGGVYEILDAATANEVTILDRATGEVTQPAQVVKRPALPVIAWEGIAVLDSGVVIAGDELRPGTPEDEGGAGADSDGGAIFKFIPAVPWDGTPLAGLDDSPLVAGSVHAFQASCFGGSQQYGQGCEIGAGAWIPVGAATARFDADTAGASGYYRPEDLHDDPDYPGPGVRVCWTDTGNEGAINYAEVMCGIDADPLLSDPAQQTFEVNRFVEGDPDFNSFDNLAFQPGSGSLYVIEDHANGDIFACLRDGGDRDIKTDGCVRILSVKDQSAEPTGFGFSPDGTVAYLSIQHSDDGDEPEFVVDDYPTDDVVVITGFRLP